MRLGKLVSGFYPHFKNHLPPPIAKLLPWVVRDLPSALVDVMLADSVGDPQPAVREFDLKLTPLRQAWAVV